MTLSAIINELIDLKIARIMNRYYFAQAESVVKKDDARIAELNKLLDVYGQD